MTRRGGRLVTLSAPPSADKAAALGVHAMFFIVTPDAAELATLAGLVDEGRLRPVVSQVFPLRDGRQAFESATKPHPPGKTVLIVRYLAWNRTNRAREGPKVIQRQVIRMQSSLDGPTRGPLRVCGAEVLGPPALGYGPPARARAAGSMRPETIS